ncbi:hypothetical protein A9Q84_10065 [Halobacteriovorax marinus]|uniref:Amine oxidase domain-containing protein n=1 Tax=Halobacteriovorax marinus TaxID=97084 RepID=A0A1Y5F700_9BACT|nr:hypothetical protein A9Q84_10065 [Halobacteriovorax marinus]
MKKFILLILLFINSTFAFTDSADIPEVFQREYISTNVLKHDYVQTYGVYTCVAVVIYGENAQAVMAHFDSGTDIRKGIKEILREFNHSFRVELYGGQAPFNLEKKIVSELKVHGVEVSKVARNETSDSSKNITLDLNTGDVFDYDEIISSTPYNKRSAKMDRIKFSRRLSRHEDSVGGGDFLQVSDSEEFSIFPF